MKTVMIDGKEYREVRKEPLGNLPYVVVRSTNAGVFAGYLKRRDGQEVELLQARRCWYWSGAASLSQLAMEGVKNPEECKFPCEVDRIVILETIEVIDCTDDAQLSIASVPVWKA